MAEELGSEQPGRNLNWVNGLLSWGQSEGPAAPGQSSAGLWNQLGKRSRCSRAASGPGIRQRERQGSPASAEPGA